MILVLFIMKNDDRKLNIYFNIFFMYTKKNNTDIKRGRMMKKKSLLKIMLIFILNIVFTYGSTVYQFENGIPENIKVSETSKLEITNLKSKDGNNSLKWTFKGNDTLSILGDVGYSTFKNGGYEKSRSSYVMWVYNKEAFDDKMLVQFKKNHQIKTSFEMSMNFQGWRTIWVQYDRDMTGTPEEGMDEIVLISPKKSGEILIDQIIPSVLIDPRHNTRDEQVNFVNLDADTSVNTHWMSLYKNYNAITKLEGKALTQNEISGIKSIETRFRDNILKKTKVNDEIIKENEKKLDFYKTKTIASPQTIVVYRDFNDEQKEKLRDIYILEYGKWLRELAFMYNSTEKESQKNKIYSIFKEALDYLYDQGWSRGSGQGTIHHLGYQVRELYQAVFLMKAPLIKDGQLKKASEMVRWYSALGIIFTPEEKIKGVNADILNTMLPGMLMGILLNEDEKNIGQELRQFNKYLTKSIDYAPGLIGGFKKDGSMFHHMQNYPAYAKGAYEGLAPIIYYLGNTPFALDKNAYEIVKNAMLMTRVYSNKKTWLLTLTGRHPENIFEIADDIFRYTAFGREEGVDKDLAEAYLRLSPDGKYSDELRKLGFKEEKAPNGSWTMNMGSLQLQRRDEWLAGVKGFSRYLVGNETYVKNNLYGRYMSYGTFQIVENSLKESGFESDGWNWAHYPGTTAINLPLEKLRSSLSQVDAQSGIEEMLISDETYSGGNSLNNNGMFAMKLHENAKYNGSHRARKSVFFFENRAILLGSNIENNDGENETHTTLFQNYLNEKEVTFENKKISENNFILDSQNNLYKIVDGEVVYKKGLQNSYNHKNGKPTKNNFELAYINHNKAPKDESYEFSILIKGNKDEQEKFKKDSGYKVLQKDYRAHIVEDKISGMKGYALFESGEIKNDKFIKSVDIPSMILLASKNKSLEISFVDPDLRLYEGIDETQYDEKGNMKEVNIYSRKWNGNESIPHTSSIILKGKYKLEKENKDVKVEIKNGETIIKITTTYALPVKINLVKID